MRVDLPRLAHARALMLGSSDFPPAAHLDYLRSHALEPPAGPGLGRLEVADLLLRDVDPAAERVEIIRVVAETLIAFGQPGVMLDPASIRTVPPGLVAAQLTWFGLERAGRLIGLHGGFFWDEPLWIRRFYGVLGDTYPWDVHFAIESHIYGHLWGQGMREAMIQIPAGTPNLAARRAQGWTDSHEIHFSRNRRPFQWLRKAFPGRPRPPGSPRPVVGADWRQMAEGSLLTRELGAPDESAAVPLLCQAALTADCCRGDVEKATALWRRWLMESTVVGTFDPAGELVALRVYDHMEPGIVRQRMTAYAASAFDANGVLRPAVAMGALAFARRARITRILITFSGDATTLDTKARILTRYGWQIAPGTGGTRDGVLEVAELARHVPALTPPDEETRA